MLCIICGDVLTDPIFATICGHLFHYSCLRTWICTSAQTCPQCRHEVTRKQIFRVYLTLSGSEVSADQFATVQGRLDDKNLELRQQKVATKDAEKRLAELSRQLRTNEELLKAKDERISNVESNLTLIKEEIVQLKIIKANTLKVKQENEKLKRTLETLKGVQKILNETNDEVEPMLESHTDIRNLATFAVALKRGLCHSEDGNKELRQKNQLLSRQVEAEKMKNAELVEKIIRLQRKPAIDKKRTACLPHDHTSNAQTAATVSCPGAETIKKTTISNKIKGHESYLNLKQSSAALAVLQRPSACGSGVLTTGTSKPPESTRQNFPATSILRSLSPSSASTSHQNKSVQFNLNAQTEAMNRPSTSRQETDEMNRPSTSSQQTEAMNIPSTSQSNTHSFHFEAPNPADELNTENEDPDLLFALGAHTRTRSSFRLPKSGIRRTGIRKLTTRHKPVQSKQEDAKCLGRKPWK